VNPDQIKRAEETKDGKRFVLKVYLKDQKDPTVLYYQDEKLFKLDKQALANFFKK